ncbi:MAG: glycosyltransferase [Acidobacteriota bacterium]
MKELTVLITNNTLADRAGTELYVRDLALALLRRGHKPIACSNILGEVAREIRAATIPVIDDPACLTVPPDIIHGHHHLDTMTALLTFPETPAIHYCHGWLPWQEWAPVFPRIYRYVAVDNVCRDRLLFECGIPENAITVIHNFVDLERFQPRSSLPLQPLRALIFSNYANEQSHLPVISRACEQLEIELSVVGAGSGNPVARPELELGKYDLVFAKGRSALEALAVGAAVVLCDGTGVGPMVTTDNLSQLRSLNFGVRNLQYPLNPEVLIREISRYDATNAAEVSAQVRATAGMDQAVDRLLALYETVIEEHREKGSASGREDQMAAARYLQKQSHRIKTIDVVLAEGGPSALRERELLLWQLGQDKEHLLWELKPFASLGLVSILNWIRTTRITKKLRQFFVGIRKADSFGQDKQGR